MNKGQLVNLIEQDLIDLEPSSLSYEYTEDSFLVSELFQALKKRWKPALGVASTVFAGIFLGTILQVPLYESETLILLDKKQQSASILPEDGIAGQLYDSDDLSTEIEILRSYSLVSSAIDAQPEVFKDLTMKEVRNNLLIKQSGDADVLIVSYVNDDPQKSQAILEVLGSTYVEYSLNRQRSQAANGVEFIAEQLPQAQEELEEVTQKVRDFRQNYGMVNPDAYAIKLSEQKQSLEQLAKDTKTDLNAKQQEYEQVRNQLNKVQQDPEQAFAYAVLSEDEVYQDLANNLSQIETEYAQKSAKFNRNHPILLDLRDRQESMQKLLEKRARENIGDAVEDMDVNQASPVREEQGIRQTLTNQLIQLETALVGVRARIKGVERAQTEVLKNFRQLPKLQQNFGELQRQLKVKSQTVNFLLEKQQELEISKAQENAPWQIIEPPLLPDAPISPNKTKGTLLALVAGGISGILTAMLLQRLDRRVKQVEEIRRITELPMLGAVPKVSAPTITSASDSQLTSSYGYSAFTESLRSVAMNLRYLVNKTGRIKTISITSANAGEGKSTVTYNLGLVLADLGLKVLIVDADLRKPKIHKLSQQLNEQGLSTAIAMEYSWLELIQPGAVENVHILTAGPKTPNPVALLNSPKMKEMIAEWQEVYDYILIDTPPASLMADAQTIASQVDSLIFVSGIDRANRGGIHRALEQLRGTDCHIGGFVANFIGKGHNYYSYSYYDYYQSYDKDDSDDGGTKKENRLLRPFLRR
ncbi:MAG: polysaccharide biosynthesis tyrosine autokinase [Cyanobacteria bacterium J06600_6]